MEDGAIYKDKRTGWKGVFMRPQETRNWPETRNPDNPIYGLVAKGPKGSAESRSSRAEDMELVAPAQTNDNGDVVYPDPLPSGF